MSKKKEWEKYERAMFNELYYVYRPPHFIVLPDFKEVIGQFSKVNRQIDVVVFEQEDKINPFLAVECKHYNRKLDVKDIETWIGMVDDIGAKESILVCPEGFTKGAISRAKAANIITYTLPRIDGKRLNLRDIVRQTFPWDETFHPEMGDALFTFNESSSFNEWIDSVENLPFEEWMDTFNNFIQLNANKSRKILWNIAQLHWDDGWRFNAIQLLEEYEWIDKTFCTFLLEHEKDFDTRELIENIMESKRA